MKSSGTSAKQLLMPARLSEFIWLLSLLNYFAPRAEANFVRTRTGLALLARRLAR
jgi:hypothetical protein